MSEQQRPGAPQTGQSGEIAELKQQLAAMQQRMDAMLVALAAKAPPEQFVFPGGGGAAPDARSPAVLTRMAREYAEDSERPKHEVKGWSERYFRMNTDVGNFWGPVEKAGPRDRVTGIQEKKITPGEIVQGWMLDPRHVFANRGPDRTSPIPELLLVKKGPDKWLIDNINRLLGYINPHRPDLGPHIIECDEHGNELRRYGPLPGAERAA